MTLQRKAESSQHVDVLTFQAPTGKRAADGGKNGDFVAQLAAFAPPPKDSRFVISTFPDYVKRQLELFGASVPPEIIMAPITLSGTAAFCLRVGLTMIERIPGVERLRESRAAVLAAGDDNEIAWFDAWTFKVGSRHTNAPTLFARAWPEDATRCNQLAAYVFGLPASTVACLAIEAALLHVPAIADHHKAAMADELTTFIRKVNARAREAVERAQRARPTMKKLRVTFEDVLRAGGEDK